MNADRTLTRMGSDMFDIDREHPDYVRGRQVWRQYRDLYTGGEQLRLNAQHYLVRRQREPGDVYAERLAGCFTRTTSGRSSTGTRRRCSGGSR